MAAAAAAAAEAAAACALTLPVQRVKACFLGFLATPCPAGRAGTATERPSPPGGGGVHEIIGTAVLACGRERVSISFFFCPPRHLSTEATRIRGRAARKEKKERKIP